MGNPPRHNRPTRLPANESSSCVRSASERDRAAGSANAGQARLSQDSEAAIERLAEWGCDPVKLRGWVAGILQGVESHGIPAQHDRLAVHVAQLADELEAFYGTFEGAVLTLGSEAWRLEFGGIPSKLRSLLVALNGLRAFRVQGKGNLMLQQQRLWLIAYTIAMTGKPRYEQLSVLIYECEGKSVDTEALKDFRRRHAAVINAGVVMLKRSLRSAHPDGQR